MATRTKMRGGKGRAGATASQPKRKRTPSNRTRTATAAKMVVDRRRVLAFGMAATALTLLPVTAVAEVATDLPQPSFIAEAKRAIALVDEWRRLGDELKEVDAALKSMSRADTRRSGYLVRVNDLPVERFRAALMADQALRDTLRMKTTERKDAAIKDALLLSLMEMTGKQPAVLRRELQSTSGLISA